VSPDSAPIPLPGRCPTSSACEPYFDFIELSLSKGRNAKAIYQDLVDSHGFAGRYASVKRFVRRLRGQPHRLYCCHQFLPLSKLRPGLGGGSLPAIRRRKNIQHKLFNRSRRSVLFANAAPTERALRR
jgi:hypothetical protein